MSDIQIGFGWSDNAVLNKALDEAVATAKASLTGEAKAAYITATVEHDTESVLAGFRQRLPGVNFHGGTTSLGLLTSDGVKNSGQGVVGVMLFASDADGEFHTASSTETDGHKAGRQVAEALKNAGGGRDPILILFNATPGDEESILEGIAEVLPDVPCQGGSAADHAIAGEWSLFTDAGCAKVGVSCLGIYGEVKVGTSMVSPYTCAGPRGTVTGTGNHRNLTTIDGKPAAEVLGSWLDGSIDTILAEGGNILAQTALHPIAIQRKKSDGSEHLITVHPAHVHADQGSIDVFARVRVGDVVCSMKGDEDRLVGALPHLVDRALEQGGLAMNEVRGATLIFCAGCAAALGPRIEESLLKLRERFRDVPLMGLCTFGEQGFVPEFGSTHQDLSLSITLFA